MPPRKRSNETRKVTVTGPVFEPGNPIAFRDFLATRMEPEAKRIKAVVEAKAPRSGLPRRKGYSSETLAESIRARVVAPKTKKPQVVLVVEGLAYRPQTPGDPPRRYGKVPYGVFQDNANGFISDTLATEHLGLLRVLQSAAGEWTRDMNTRGAARGRVA